MSGSEEENYARNRANMTKLEDRCARVRDLNDRFRRDHGGGFTMVTSGIQALGAAACAIILQAVSEFDEFTAENDPYGEHDFGALSIVGHRIFWKIDYYDESLEYGSPDPTDPLVTARVITVMLASEY